MSQELSINKRCICLRNGNEIWISETVYQRIKVAKAQATGSILLHISELDRDVNTADIVEICKVEQMSDKRRIEAGERKCEYGKWHNRKFPCHCYQDEIERLKRETKLVEESLGDRPRTKEEQEKIDVALRTARKNLEKSGVLTPKI